MSKVIFVINKEGAVELKTEGFQGASCMEATKDIEAILGEVEKLEHTTEYYDGKDNEYQNLIRH